MDTKELLAQIVTKGGKILLVGGGLSKLGADYLNHPGIIVWDDEKQDHNSKHVPGSVKVIMWNRLVSHATVDKLNNAIHSLGAIKMPMLVNHEIKNYLSKIVPTEKKEDRLIPLSAPLDSPITEPTPLEEGKEEMPKQVDKGALQKFLAKNMNIQIDYSQRGSIAKEANRLFPKAKSDGIKTTIGSLTQAVGKLAKNLSKAKHQPASSSAAKSTNDDFEELDKLLADAVAAMKLIQEHLPKVRKEVEKLRSSREKMLKLLE